MDNYSLDKCSICGKHKALKNGVCAECDKKIKMPQWFNDFFGIKEKNER